MLRQRIGIVFLLLACGLYFSHTLVPHHHHSEAELYAELLSHHGYDHDDADHHHHHFPHQHTQVDWLKPSALSVNPDNTFVALLFIVGQNTQIPPLYSCLTKWKYEPPPTPPLSRRHKSANIVRGSPVV